MPSSAPSSTCRGSRTGDASPPGFRIVVNRALDVVRADRRLVGLGELRETLTAWEAEESPDGEALAALAALSPERRAVVVLRHLLDYSPAEIAELLGLPLGTVHSRLARALAELRARMGGGDG